MENSCKTYLSPSFHPTKRAETYRSLNSRGQIKNQPAHKKKFGVRLTNESMNTLGLTLMQPLICTVLTFSPEYLSFTHGSDLLVVFSPRLAFQDFYCTCYQTTPFVVLLYFSQRKWAMALPSSVFFLTGVLTLTSFTTWGLRGFL